MQFSKEQALELLTLNEQAYVLATTGHCQLPEGFTEPVPIRMSAQHRPFFLQGDPLDIWGYVTTKNGVKHIVYRGTEITSGFRLMQEWAEDALSLPMVQERQGRVHLGFFGARESLRAVTSLAANLRFRDKVVLTGHSLGAALATLAWADILNCDLMTFACPRVGDADFAQALWQGNTIRVINETDIVPKVPTDPPFRHGGLEIRVLGPGYHDPKLAHSLEAYREGINTGWTEHR